MARQFAAPPPRLQHRHGTLQGRPAVHLVGARRVSRRGRSVVDQADRAEQRRLHPRERTVPNSVGSIAGPTTFIPGVGLRFHAQLSSVTYALQQTLTEGEFSMLTTGMDTNTDGDKTKTSMAEGYDDVVTNNRRFTVEKTWPSGGRSSLALYYARRSNDTLGAERQTVSLTRVRPTLRDLAREPGPACSFSVVASAVRPSTTCRKPLPVARTIPARTSPISVCALQRKAVVRQSTT